MSEWKRDLNLDGEGGGGGDGGEGGGGGDSLHVAKGRNLAFGLRRKNKSASPQVTNKWR